MVRRHLLLATVLVLATATAGVAVGSQESVTALGTDHPLATSDATERFHEAGAVNGSVVAPAVTLHVATDYDTGAGLSGEPDYSPGYVYLRVDYDETIPRTLRFQLPAAYWHPYPANIEAEQGGPTAQLRPTPDGNHTTVTVHVDGQTDAVYAVPMAAASVYAARDFGREVTENVTGVRVPRVGSSQPWKYLDPQALAGSNNTVGIIVEDRDVTIQYDPKGDGGERWLSVPACDATVADEASVCRFRKEGHNGTVYLLARERFNTSTNPAPTVRYKFDAGLLTQLGSLLDGVRVTVQRTLDMLGGLFPGGGG